MRVLHCLSRKLAFIAVSLTLTGCVATMEGPAPAGWARFGSNDWYVCHQRLQATGADAESIVEACNKKLVLVGRASAFREFEGADADEFYKEYREFAKSVRTDSSPEVSSQEFRVEYAGWTRLKIVTGFGIFGPSSLYEDVLVPRRLRWEIDFPSSTATILYQGAGDLVAAVTTTDGFYVAYKVLCQEDADFNSCAKNYPTGLFDAITGIQVGASLEPLENGRKLPVQILPE